MDHKFGIRMYEFQPIYKSLRYSRRRWGNSYFKKKIDLVFLQVMLHVGVPYIWNFLIHQLQVILTSQPDKN